LHEKTLERQLLEVCNKISADILKGDDNISELIVKSEKQIMDVINGQRVSDFKRIDLLTDSVIDIIEENKNKEGNLVGIDTGYPDLNLITSGFKKNELIMLENAVMWVVTKFITVEKVSAVVAKLTTKLLEYARNKGDAAWDTAKKVVQQIIKWCNLFLEIYDDDTLTPEEEAKLAEEIANMTDAATLKKLLKKIK
jgi:hypothetical protein